MIRELGDVTATSREQIRPPSLAKRTVAWATNLLATGLIAILGLVVGRQMLDWWHTDSTVRPIVRAPQSPSFGMDAAGLSFGNSPSQFRRWQFRGDLAGVLHDLRKASRAASESARSSHPLTLAENRLLEQIANLQPVEIEPGRFRIFELAKPLPMVVAISDQAQSSERASAQVVATQNGVLSWGLAFPAETASDDTSEWTLISFSPTAEVATAANQLTLPASCQRLIAIPFGHSSLVGFTSASAQDDLAREWDDTLIAGGWQTQGKWHMIGKACHRRFARDAVTVEIQFVQGLAGDITGFASTSLLGSP